MVSEKVPVSVALVGMRDLRDYIAQSKDGVPVNPGSPFNIKEDSVTLTNFDRDETQALLAQHTSETGRTFRPDAVEAIWYWSQGQPDIVNALAKECVWRTTHEDFSRATTANMVLIAKNPIQACTTHLDSLAERLKTPDVKRVIQMILVEGIPIRFERMDRVERDRYFQHLRTGLLRGCRAHVSSTRLLGAQGLELAVMARPFGGSRVRFWRNGRVSSIGCFRTGWSLRRAWSGSASPTRVGPP